MDDRQQPDLSLGSCRSNLSLSSEAKNSSSESDLNAPSPAPAANNPSRKRKPSSWDSLDDANLINHATIDLQLNHHPLPLDWEQCLDLQSGRMYYLNRKSLKRSWTRPREEKQLDLELNISSAIPPRVEKKVSDDELQEDGKMSTSAGNMVAAVCMNCHLLVMLCKSSPSCPNCKCNSLPPPLPALMMTTSDKLETVKSLKTLSLLH